jgi:hypothetical protein
VHKGSVAEESGMRMGDRVLCVDGEPLRGMLKDALAGKNETELLVAVDTEGGEGGGDADGDGELDEGESGVGWEVSQDRIVATLLSKRAPPDNGLNVGDNVFVMTGDWREAVVEQQVNEQYLLHLGHGERRWASGGEIAWHDLGPKPYDIAPGKVMLGCDAVRAQSPKLHHVTRPSMTALSHSPPTSPIDGGPFCRVRALRSQLGGECEGVPERHDASLRGQVVVGALRLLPGAQAADLSAARALGTAATCDGLLGRLSLGQGA